MRYSPFRHVGSVFWKKNPIQLTFFLTKKCNVRCRHCFYLSGQADSKNGAPELSLPEIDRICSSLGNLLWLAFSGGEIFLREDLVEITRLFYRKNRPAIILLPTNGMLTERIVEKTEAILKSCPKSVVALKLSIDGDEKLHDSLKGAPGSYGKIMATYNALEPLLDKHKNFEIGVNTVFCSENQADMENIIRRAGAMKKIRAHTVSLIRGEVADGGLKNVDIGKYLQAAEMIEARIKRGESGRYAFRGGGIKAAQDIVQRRLIHETYRKRKRITKCFAGRLTLVLTESGDLYPCESFSMKIGNVREWGYDVKRMLKSGEGRQTLAAVDTCGCYCTHECYQMMNILFNPFLYPSLLKERIMIMM